MGVPPDTPPALSEPVRRPTPLIGPSLRGVSRSALRAVAPVFRWPTGCSTPLTKLRKTWAFCHLGRPRTSTPCPRGGTYLLPEKGLHEGRRAAVLRWVVQGRGLEALPGAVGIGFADTPFVCVGANPAPC
jgi:hypothetical protein